jgi:hypothetical protein
MKSTSNRSLSKSSVAKKVAPVSATTPVTAVATTETSKVIASTAAVAPTLTVAERKAQADAKKLRSAIISASRSAQGRIGISPVDAGDVKKNHIISIKGQPCKVCHNVNVNVI